MPAVRTGPPGVPSSCKQALSQVIRLVARRRCFYCWSNFGTLEYQNIMAFLVVKNGPRRFRVDELFPSNGLHGRSQISGLEEKHCFVIGGVRLSPLPLETNKPCSTSRSIGFCSTGTWA